MSLLPPYLKKGDCIAVVATARKITREELAPAVNWLKRQGFEVKLGASIGLADRQFGGTDAERAADLQAQLKDPAVKAVLCARGGYGTVRVVDSIDWKSFLAQPKWICGYSDVTVLHAQAQKLGVASLHCTMPLNFNESAEATSGWQSLLAALQGQPVDYDWRAFRYLRGDSMSGKVVGGNLSVLYSLLGSATLPDFRGKILFLEDLDEYLYHVDRMMMGLKRAGKLEGLAGLLLGGLTQMNDNAIGFGKSAEEIVFEAVESENYPVAAGFPAGHQALNQALVLGGQLRLP